MPSGRGADGSDVGCYTCTMDYPANGHVEPGGPTATTTDEATGVEIRKLSVGPMDNNVYVLVSDGEALLIDAANESDRILAELEDLDVTHIVTTHGHWDHVQALAAVSEATHGEVSVHGGDAEMLPISPDRHLEHGETLTFGSASVEIVHHPGHTPGSVSVLLGDAHAFTGDTLFPGGTGRTESAEDFETIIAQVTEKLFGRLPDDCAVHPGHGDDTTIGTERPKLPEWRERGW